MATDDIFKDYPAYQATYMKGEVNFTVRGDSTTKVMDGIKAMITNWDGWVGSEGSVSSMPPAPTKTEVCPECGGEMVFKKGVSKAGKPYQGMFCQNKTCGHVNWLS